MIQMIKDCHECSLARVKTNQIDDDDGLTKNVEGQNQKTETVCRIFL